MSSNYYIYKNYIQLEQSFRNQASSLGWAGVVARIEYIEMHILKGQKTFWGKAVLWHLPGPFWSLVFRSRIQVLPRLVTPALMQTIHKTSEFILEIIRGMAVFSEPEVEHVVS